MLIFRGMADTHEVQNVFLLYAHTHTHHLFFSQWCIRRWGEGSNFHLKETSITFRVPKLTFTETKKTHKLDFMGWNQMFCILPIWFRYLFTSWNQVIQKQKNHKTFTTWSHQKPPWELALLPTLPFRNLVPTNQPICPPQKTGKVTIQGINISHLGKRKIIFKMPFLGDMLVSWRLNTNPAGKIQDPGDSQFLFEFHTYQKGLMVPSINRSYQHDVDTSCKSYQWSILVR